VVDSPTVSVKLCVAFVPTPFVAVIVIGKEPDTAVVPDNRPAVLRVMPDGSVPVSEKVGAGYPVAVTVNDPAAFGVNVVLLALVIDGAWLMVKVKEFVETATPA
jgi:hypothetical protein